MAAEFVPLLPSRRTERQKEPALDAETFAATMPEVIPVPPSPPMPMKLLLAVALLLYALVTIVVVAVAQSSIPVWLYQTILSLGLLVLLGVSLLFVFGMI